MIFFIGKYIIFCLHWDLNLEPSIILPQYFCIKKIKSKKMNQHLQWFKLQKSNMMKEIPTNFTTNQYQGLDLYFLLYVYDSHQILLVYKLLRIKEYSLDILWFISYIFCTLSSFLLHFILFPFCSIILYIYKCLYTM